jgi:hypothetical protein
MACAELCEKQGYSVLRGPWRKTQTSLLELEVLLEVCTLLQSNFPFRWLINSGQAAE